MVVDALIAVNRQRIVTYALSAHLPTMFNNRVHVQAGGLMHMAPTSQINTDVPRNWRIRSCTEPNQAIFRLSSQLNSSWR